MGDEQMVKDIINVNVVAGTTLIHALLPDMIRKRKGAIINISSACSAFPVPYLATYSATKHFIDAFTKAITAEYQDSGVTFQLVDPGQVDTQMTALFANKLTWSVPSPSTYVKSTIKRIGFSSHTSGYWPHSFQLVHVFFPSMSHFKTYVERRKKPIQSRITDEVIAKQAKMMFGFKYIKRLVL